MNDEFASIELALIESSLTNPRKSFDPVKLAELADSIRASGVHQPVLVRPLPGSRVEETTWIPHQAKARAVRPIYELVCGERRYRASALAEVATIPAMIRDLTDEQVLEIQLVENLQRDDLAELEEAEGYEALMQHSGINADAVGAKIGKSRSYVYARLKLLDLSVECKQAMRDGKIDASRALLIARIPDGKLQLKALEYATEPGYQDDMPSVRELQRWLRQNVMLVLDRATFKITDARLVKAAGSCTACPKRTGANPDLFIEVDSADICTDPACFHGKEAAHRAELVKRAESKGMRMVEGKEAQEMCKPWQTVPDGYSTLGQVRSDLATEGQEPDTLRHLLGKDAPNAILFEHPRTKELMELVPTEEAEAVLLAKGLLKVENSTASRNASDLQHELERLQKTVERQTAVAIHKATFNAAVDAIRCTPDKDAPALFGAAFLRAWLALQIDCTDEEYLARALGYTFQEGEDEADGLTMHIQACSSANLYRATAILMAYEDMHLPYGDNVPTILNALVTQLAIDTKAVSKGAKDTVKAEYAGKIRVAKAEIEAQKPVLPTTPLAQPNLAAGKGPKAEAKTSRGPLRKPRLSEEDAKSGIAAAMQGMEQPASPEGVARAEGQQGELAGQPLPGESFVVGQRVAVTTDSSRLGMIAVKWSGKQGTITNREPGGGFWDVTFRGRNGGIATFADDQLVAVAACE
jgi:ParB/RepB/Spo0J family partition protein